MQNQSKAALKKLLLPIVLFAVLIIPLFVGGFVSYEVKSFFYALSLSLKAVLLFILPFIIFSFLFASLLNLRSGVVMFIIMLVGMIFVSNSIAIWTGFTVGSIALPKLSISTHVMSSAIHVLEPLWLFTLPKLIPNEAALIVGFVLGVFFSLKRNAKVELFAKRFSHVSTVFLKRFFTPILPIFILGFVFKLEQDQQLTMALRHFGPVFFIVIGTQITYLLTLYFIAAGCSVRQFVEYIKNVLPATITGFSTVSSAASMPVLITCTEKNLDNPQVARCVIPAIINTHTLGSAIALTILSMTTLIIFGHHLPSAAEFFQFGLFYALAKFAVAAVPGGVILVAAPLLETYLHFSSEMIGLITAIYMLFDPFGTGVNVTGNGFFPIAFSKLYKFELEDVEQSPELSS